MTTALRGADVRTVLHLPKADEEQTHASTPASWTTLAKIPFHFLTSLFEPFINQDAQDFYHHHATEIKTKGITGYTWSAIQNAGHTIKTQPLDTFLFVGAMTLNTGLEAGAPLIHGLVQTAVVFKNAQFVKKVTASIDASTLAGKGIKFTIYGTLACHLLSLPVAAALEWNSLAAAKNYYSGGTCPDHPWKPLLSPIIECLDKTGTLQQCFEKITDRTESDFYVFTRHASNNPELDPVSIIKLDKARTCIYTALHRTSEVTKTCFSSSNLDSRTVEEVPQLSLTQSHEGLTPGESVIHVGMRLQNDPQQACAHFRTAPAKYELGEHPVCLLTSLRPGGAVSQICLNPNQPESLTLKGVTGIKLDQPGNQGPVSLYIENPQKLGLETGPVTIKPSADAPCPTKSKGFSFMEALSWWWNQKTPCDEAPEPKATRRDKEL